MAASTSTKSRKPSTKTTTKRKPKTTGKKTTATPKRAVSKRTVSPRRDEFTAAAKLATEMVTVNAAGKPINRAPISTVRVGAVSDKIGRRKPGDVIASIMFGSGKRKRGESVAAALKLADKYGRAQIGQTDLPEGARLRLTEASRMIGDPTVHKINGRAMTAVLVALAKTK